MMKKFQVMLLMISLSLFICPSLLSAESWDSNDRSGSCNTLTLKIQVLAEKGANWVISPMNCSSGSVLFNTKHPGKYFVYGLKGNGISCEFTAYNGKHPGSVNKYKFSQNYCVLLGGDIKVKRVSGPFAQDYAIIKGQYNPLSKNQRGYLHIAIFDTYPD